MRSYNILLLTSLLISAQILVGCGEDEPDPVYPEPAQLFEEGKYTITRLETNFTDFNGDSIGVPKSETHYPYHFFTLKGPSHFREELTGVANSATSGDYLVNVPAKTIRLTIDQPLFIPSGNYQIDSLTDKRLVMHVTTTNQSTGVTKTFRVRANR